MRTSSVPNRLSKRLNLAFIETSIVRHHLFWAEKRQRRRRKAPELPVSALMERC